MFTYITIFFLAALLALIFTPLAIKTAKKFNVMDYPEERRVHTVPTPRMGGVAIYLSFWLAVVLTMNLNTMVVGLFLGSALIVIVGIVDDIRGIRALPKLACQIIASIIPLFFGLSVQQITLPLLGTVELGLIGYIFAVFWIVGIVNTVNISDGLDGLAAGICFIAALILFWSADKIDQVVASHFMLALAGVALGFLFYNFHPARIFMGDSGSMFLGYIIGAVSLWGLLKTATVFGLVFPLLVLGMPLVDLVCAVIRRKWKGKSIIRADKGHLHHRLLDAGLTQRQAVLVLYLISICFGLAAILSVYGHLYIALLLVITNILFILSIMFRKYQTLKSFNRKSFYVKNKEE
mgnify:FL=1